jgi:hypothetical protein
MIELTKVERENKVYVNDRVIVLDTDTITASELLEMAGFSSLVYVIYLIQNNEKKNKKGNKPLIENKKIKIETGMHFAANLKSN